MSAKPSAYLRMRVLGAIEHAPGKTIQERIRNTAKNIFTDEEGQPRQFTSSTISTWLYRYKSQGITGIENKNRSDKGKTRKITPEELLEAVNQILPMFREKTHYNKSDIYRACIENGVINKNQLAPTTFYRFIKEFDLLKDEVEHNKKRLAFAMQYANQLWQADTLYGPYVRDQSGKAVQTRLIAFIDDASRILCHGQFFFNENTGSMTTAIRTAFYKRGVPEQLYVDNGSIYVCQEITLICARVGCILRHAPLRDGAAKGKIERFFRTVRLKFLNRQLDLSSITILNKQFQTWVEEEYNNIPHSSLGMKPIDRFGLDLSRIHFLPPNEVNDELFFAENTRKVKKDNTFSFNAIRYEAPVDVRNKKITVRFDRHKKDRIIVYYKNQRMDEAKPVNLVANAIRRNKTLKERNN